MIRSMYSGVSGMKGFQVKLDVIGNNIANVNTVGFKKSRTVFQDLLSQNLASPTGPNPGLTGGINARQIGLGTNIAAIDVLHTPGSPMMTGVPTDLAIAGDGFFLIMQPGGNMNNPLYTKAGNFMFDANRQLVTSTGALVVGKSVVEVVNGVATATLNADGDPEFNFLGDPDDNNAITVPRSIMIDGEQLEVVSYDITSNGDIVVFTEDGANHVVATIALGFVDNPAGLRKVGGSAYEMTANANPNGQHMMMRIADSGLDTALVAGVLEMSNVDLTEEFTEMIIAQRGFQANSRVITTSDEILQEVVNLKR